MASDSTDLHAILQRIQRLEAQNRRLKASGIVVLTLFSAIILMGQAMPSARVVEAQKFVVKDSDGNVRGWMGSVGKGSELILGSINSQPMIRLIVSTDAGDLHFFGNRKSGMNLGLDEGIPDISMIGAEGSGSAKISFRNPGPSLTLEDKNGSSAVLGAIQPAQPSALQGQTRSAASVVLLNKEKKVIWQAP